MKRLFKFLANRKGSAFIETLMVYVCVALMGVAVVGVATKTIKDAAAGSPYQDEIVVSTNGGGSENNEKEIVTATLTYDGAISVYSINYFEGMTWRELIELNPGYFEILETDEVCERGNPTGCSIFDLTDNVSAVYADDVVFLDHYYSR